MRKTVAKKTGAKGSTKGSAKRAAAKRSPARGVAAKGGARGGAKGGQGKPERRVYGKMPTAKPRPERKALRPKAPADAAAEAPRSEPAAERPDPSRPRAVLIAQAGLDKKAEDVLVLDVRGLTSYADYFVLMTAESDRQAGAIADSVDEKMKANGSTRVGAEGYETGRWILIDYGDVVAHVMSRDARGFYDLEGLWADAPRFEVTG